MCGRLLFFLIGMYAGVVANQQYQMPNAPTPSEAWERAAARFEKYKREHPCEHKPPHSSFYDNPEVKDIIDRLKSLERRRRSEAREDN
ncbi:unnamed protein product [Candidula unifasciata]|uniref:Uncharacterized protein n=1 Tax=Candidula unifasciata TaxID=100452 RepID=A0A8S3ZFW9_9EUPU|nr:unnamed protein product [Candidula unifasciata]